MRMFYDSVIKVENNIIIITNFKMLANWNMWFTQLVREKNKIKIDINLHSLLLKLLLQENCNF